MASIGDVAARLRAVLAMVAEAAASAKAADDRIEDAHGSLQSDLADSSNPLAHEGLSQWSAARRRLAEALALITGGTERMGEYITSVAGGSGHTAPSGSSPRPSTAGPSPSGDSAPRLENFDARRPDPRCMAKIRETGWPTNREGNTAARGYLYTADGKQLNSRPLKAYPPGQAPVHEDLKEPWASDTAMTTTWHVEGDAAAKIREDDLQDAALYLNVPLCGKRVKGSEHPDPNGCYANFERIIPADKVVYIHVVPQRGLPYRRRITGTGEGIKDDQRS